MHPPHKRLRGGSLSVQFAPTTSEQHGVPKTRRRKLDPNPAFRITDGSSRLPESTRLWDKIASVQQPAKNLLFSHGNLWQSDVEGRLFEEKCSEITLLIAHGPLSPLATVPAMNGWRAQVRAGRRVGAKLNIRDVSSRLGQRAKDVVVERLDQFNPDECQWREVLVEDRRAGPAETMAARIDVGDWF